MTQPLTTEQLDAIRERLRAAERVSPGPWTMALPGDWSDVLAGECVIKSSDHGPESDYEVLENATFIMNAKGDIDALLAEVERLRACAPSVETIEMARDALGEFYADKSELWEGRRDAWIAEIAAAVADFDRAFPVSE